MDKLESWMKEWKTAQRTHLPIVKATESPPILRRYIMILLSMAATITFAGKLLADDTLTLELPPSQGALKRRAAAKAHTAARSASQQAVRKTNAFPARGLRPSSGSPPKRIVGRLGKILQRTSVFRMQDGSGPMMTVEPGTYVALKDESASRYGVKMADGSVGWISKDQVLLLDYKVVSNDVKSNANIPHHNNVKNKTTTYHTFTMRLDSTGEGVVTGVETHRGKIAPSHKKRSKPSHYHGAPK
jgi:hypothetical protein